MWLVCVACLAGFAPKVEASAYLQAADKPDKFQLANPPVESNPLVTFDAAGVVTRIDRETWRALELWPGSFSQIVEAWLAKHEGNASGSVPAYTLYILYEDGGRRLGTVALNTTEGEWLARNVRGYLESDTADRSSGEGVSDGGRDDSRRDDFTGRDPSARNILITGTTILGLGFYSWAVPVAGDIDGGRQIVATSLLTVSASVVVPFILTANRYVPPGATHLALYGATRGAAHGAFVNRLFSGDRTTGRKDLTGAIVGSVVEGVGGYVIAKNANLSPGRAHLIEAGGDLGLLWGLGLVEMLDLDVEDEGRDRQLDYATLLAGSAVGLGTGAVLGPHLRATWGDAEIIRTTSLLSSGFGGSLAWAVLGGDDDDFDDDDDDADVVLGAGLASGLAGVWLGHYLTSDRDFSTGEAVLMDLVSIAGGALGAGLSYLAMSDNSDDRGRVIALSAAVGAGAGFGLLYNGYAPRAARRGDTGSLEGERGSGVGTGVRTGVGTGVGSGVGTGVGTDRSAGLAWRAGFAMTSVETAEGQRLVPGLRVSVTGLLD